MSDNTYLNYPSELNPLPLIRETPPWVIPGTTAGGPMGTIQATAQGFPQGTGQVIPQGSPLAIPGTTAGTTSPGVMGFPGFSPAPLLYGSQAPIPEAGGPTTAPVGPGDSSFITAPGSPVYLGEEYTQGYLRSIIGETVRVEFLIGEDTITDRRGKLLEVGISYIVLLEAESDDILMCDIYSIKFVTVYR